MVDPEPIARRWRFALGRFPFPRLTDFVFAFILTFPLFSVRADPGCEVEAGKVVSVQGRVAVSGPGMANWVPIAPSDAICVGASLRVSHNSRAAVLLANDTLLRLDQDTAVTFSEIQPAKPSWLKLISGALHSISRTRVFMRIEAPHQTNAAIEGTEFSLRVGRDSTKIWVFEGRVKFTNDYGALHLGADQAAIAQVSGAPRRFTEILPRNAVRWALYYPPIVDYRSVAYPRGKAGIAIQQALQQYRADDIGAALAVLDAVPEQARDGRFLALRAGLLLSVGRVDEAGVDIDRAIAEDANNAEVIALKSIVALTTNRADQAQALAEQAVALDAGSPVPLVTLSYANQARFDLPAARDAVQRAVDLAPANALAWGRLSELQLALGQLDEAMSSAERAATLDPQNTRGHTVLGFAMLTRSRARDAVSEFESAIAADPAFPLPRLGLGLARIRLGDLDRGVEQIEIATILNPDNALIRSYLGKGYYEQRRLELAAVEYANAKALDPNDPTAFFYDSILKLVTNRPVDALADNQRAIELNDNRAVFRSRLLLDQDAAARGAAQARIFQNLGFEQLGLVEGWKAVNDDPANFSAHRLLADAYAVLPRHEIAQVSELLQSQLLQPLNVTPIQPQLSAGSLAILPSLGPTSPGLSEYTPLFTRNGLSAQLNALFGTDETFSNDLILSAIHDNLSFSAGQFHYEGDGYRQNNDQTQNIYNLFAQYSVSPEFSLQFEARHRDLEFGDLKQRFDGSFHPDDRRDIERESLRAGLRYSFSPRSHLLLSFIHDTETDKLHSERSFSFSEVVAAPFMVDPSLPPLSLLTRIDIDRDFVVDGKGESDKDTLELRYILDGDWYDFSVGGGFIDQDSKVTRRNEVTATDRITTEVPGLLPPNTQTETTRTFTVAAEDTSIRHNNVYGYAKLYPAGSSAIVTLGLSYDGFDSKKRGDLSQLNPKAGITWSPTERLTLRAAGFRTLRRSLVESKTLEPTQVAGFNQFFDDVGGTDSTRYGAAADYRISKTLFSGVELTWRSLSTPVSGATVDNIDQDEETHRAYLYWTPTPRWAIRAAFLYDDYRSDATLDPELDILGLRTRIMPVGLSYFHPKGLFAGTQATGVWQDVDTSTEEHGENFWTLDATMGYRLPKRYGSISFQIRNVLDQDFNYQDNNFRTNDPQSPAFLPTRSVFLNLNLVF